MNKETLVVIWKKLKKIIEDRTGIHPDVVTYDGMSVLVTKEDLEKLLEETMTHKELNDFRFTITNESKAFQEGIRCGKHIVECELKKANVKLKKYHDMVRGANRLLHDIFDEK